MDSCPICQAEIRGKCVCGLNHWHCIHGHEWNLDKDGELRIGAPEGCEPIDEDGLSLTIASDNKEGLIQLQFAEPIQIVELGPQAAQQMAFNLISHAMGILTNAANKKDKSQGGGV
jgi:hypothetical protein